MKKTMPTLLLCLALLAGADCHKQPCQPPPDDKPPITYSDHILAAWHPSDTMVVYYKTYSSDQDSSDYIGLWAIRPDGTNNRPYLVQGMNIVFGFIGSKDWSPDGNWLVFTKMWETDIYKLKANGDSLTRLTFNGDNTDPTWSPGGQKIAYSVHLGERSGLYVMNSDGTNNQRIKQYLFKPSWLPDGKNIIAKGPLHGDTTDIYRINIETFDSIKVCYLYGGGITDITVSRDGFTIAFVRQQSGKLLQIWTMNIDGTGLRQLTGLSDPAVEGGDFPCWSSDGTKIVYSRYGYGGDNNGKLWIMNADGSNKQQLTP